MHNEINKRVIGIESKSGLQVNKRGSYQQLIIILVLFFPAVFILSAVYFTVPIINELSLVWNITHLEAAWSSSVFSICFAIGCLIYGPISNYVGRKQVIVTGLIALSVITIGCSFVTEYKHFLLLRALQGAAAASFSPVALTYIAEKFPFPNRLLVVAYISMGFLLGGIVGQLISSFFATYLYWQQLYSWMGVIYAILAMIVMLWLPSINKGLKDKLKMEDIKKVQLVKHKSWSNARQGIIRVVKGFCNKRLLMIYVITFTVLFGFVGCYTIFAIVLQDHLSSSELLWFRAYGAIGMLICPFVRYIALPLVTMLRITLTLAIVALVLISFVQQMILYILISIVFTFSIAWLVPVVIALVGIYGERHRGLSTSLYTCILFVGAALAPVVATSIVNSAYHSYSFLLFGVAYGVSLICAMKLPAVQLLLNRSTVSK